MTLAAGILNRQRQDGFSLIELLVILFILGITISFINITANHEVRQTRESAERLTALINLAQQEAILSGMNFMVRVNEKNYTFMRQNDDDKWQELDTDEVFHPREMPLGVKATTIIQGNASAREIFLSASGELTPFIITIKGKSADTKFKITGSYPDRITCQ